MWALSHKAKNKMVKMINGNVNTRKILNVIHWNMGSKYWNRKTLEAEAVVLQYQPDIFIISEANMMDDHSDLDINLQGY